MQTAIIVLIVAAAVAYLLKRILTKKPDGCGSCTRCRKPGDQP